jgi:hypothetical protein
MAALWPGRGRGLAAVSWLPDQQPGGRALLDAWEHQLARFPAIAVPAITLEGDANGAPHPHPADYSARFTGRYLHRTLTGGIGRNLPQEAPAEFARAVQEADGSPDWVRVTTPRVSCG